MEGKAYTPGFVDRNYEMLTRFAPHFIENGGIHPSKIQGELRKAIEGLIERAALALGIENGVAKGDVVITGDGKPMIIEMAARLSGGDFSESLIPLGCGVNIVKAAIRTLSDELQIYQTRQQVGTSICKPLFLRRARNLKGHSWVSRSPGITMDTQVGRLRCRGT